jgi:hypothetical protein
MAFACGMAALKFFCWPGNGIVARPTGIGAPLQSRTAVGKGQSDAVLLILPYSSSL